MKKLTIFFVVLSLFIPKLSGAQRQLDIKKIKIENVDLPLAKEKLLTLPISNLEVLDARPDDFCLGFLKDKNLWSKSSKESLEDYTAITFTNNIEKEILQNIMPAKSLQKDGFGFLFVIKELWLYDNDDSFINGDGAKVGDENTSGLLVRADIYLNRNTSHIPLFQIDSIFVSKKTLRRSKADLLQDALFTLCKKINTLPISNIYNKATRVKSQSSIDSFYSHVQKLAFTKLADTSRQYIFKTFEDFKNGTCTNARLRQLSDKLGDYYYNKDENGTEYLIRDYAFYYNGDLFIKTNNTYSKIYINKNKIYTIGSKLFSKGTTIPIGVPLPDGGFITENAKINNSRRTYQLVMLDMPTGNIY